MLLKGFGLLTPFVAGGLYVSGAFGGRAYSREIDRPPAEVAAAIEDLDITRQPGSPGTDPSASGGVLPVFTHEVLPDRVVWTVMSGDRVAARLTAMLTPLGNGTRTRVTAFVERGDAADEYTSPAFRSQGVALGLFGSALDSELNEIGAPASGSGDPKLCREIAARFAIANLTSEDLQRQDGLADAIGDTAQVAVRLGAYEAEARRYGCDPDAGLNGLMDGPDKDIAQSGPRDVSYEPGKPMVDVRRR